MFTLINLAHSVPNTPDVIKSDKMSTSCQAGVHCHIAVSNNNTRRHIVQPATKKKPCVFQRFFVTLWVTKIILLPITDTPMNLAPKILTLALAMSTAPIEAAFATSPSAAAPVAFSNRVVKVGEEPSTALIAGASVGKDALLEMVKAAESQSIVPDIISYAKKFIGTRYCRGAKGPKRFDCSGFTGYIFKEFGYRLNHSSQTQYRQGSEVMRDDIRPGDLIFFSGRRAGKNVGHVGIVTDVNPDNNSVKFIHASISGGVRIDSYPDGGYYSKRFVGVRRVLSPEDLGDL